MTSYFDPHTDEALDVLGYLAACLHVSDLLDRQADVREDSDRVEMMYSVDVPRDGDVATLTDLIVVQYEPLSKAVDRMLEPPAELRLFVPDED